MSEMLERYHTLHFDKEKFKEKLHLNVHHKD